jgi:beta-glucosidase/6-phospho-beta-glucosidase/beta-galactosidase
MYDEIKAQDAIDSDGDGQASQVGIVSAISPAHPIDPRETNDWKTAENIFYLHNLIFLDALIEGKLDADLNGQQVPRPDLGGRMDYLGVNYYSVVNVEGEAIALFPDFSPYTTFNPFTIVQDNNYPRGIYETLTALARRYPGQPFIITENGLPFTVADEVVSHSLVHHLTWLSRARPHPSMRASPRQTQFRSTCTRRTPRRRTSDAPPQTRPST